MRALGALLLLSACAPRGPLIPEAQVPWAVVCGQRITEKKLDEAMAACNQGLAVWPNDAESMHNRSLVHFLRGDRLLAKQDAVAALRMRPGYALPLNTLGILATEALDWVTAEARFREALAADPKYPAARYSLGRVLLKQQRPVDAEAEFRVLLAQGVGTYDAHLGLARALTMQHRYEEAEASVAFVIDEDPEDADAWQLRGELDLAQGRGERAREAFERCRALAPERAACAPPK